MKLINRFRYLFCVTLFVLPYFFSGVSYAQTSRDNNYEIDSESKIQPTLSLAKIKYPENEAEKNNFQIVLFLALFAMLFYHFSLLLFMRD